MIDFNIKNLKKNISIYSKGSLLLELLIAISVIAIILSFSANALFVSMRSSKISGDKDTASTLATEVLEAARSVVEEDYYKIYNTTKTSQHYYLSSTVTPGKWVLASGDESVPINGVTYTRYVVVENVCRDDTNRNITGVPGCSVGSSDDPGTQKVTVTVSWPNGNPVSISEYFSRWKNKVCDQPGWTATEPDNTLTNCGGTTFYSKDPAVNITGGTLKLQ